MQLSKFDIVIEAKGFFEIDRKFIAAVSIEKKKNTAHKTY